MDTALDEIDPYYICQKLIKIIEYYINLNQNRSWPRRCRPLAPSFGMMHCV